jgi:AcrR family transcriptional regulator
MPNRRNILARRPRARLSRQRVLERALAIADAEGLGAVKFRRLGSDFGVTAMALYAYFDTKEALLDAMADSLLCSLEIDGRAVSDKAAALMRIATALRSMMAAHPGAVRLLVDRLISTPGALEGAIERPLALLRDAGFSGADAVRAYAALMSYTVGFTLHQLAVPWGPEGPAVQEQRRRRRAFYESQPSDQFPNLVELAGPVASIVSDEQFEWGLKAIVDGIASQLGHPAAKRQPPPPQSRGTSNGGSAGRRPAKRSSGRSRPPS